MRTYVCGCIEDAGGIARVSDEKAEFWSVYVADFTDDECPSEWRSDHLSRADAEYSAGRAV